MRGIETSRMATSGRSRIARSTASTPSSASATTRIPSWRSISMMSPERTMPWSSATRIRSITAPAGTVACPTRLRLDRQLASHETGALRHAAEAETAGRPVGLEAAAVVAHRELNATALLGAEIHLDRAGVGVPPDVREGLLGDAED